MILKGMCWIAGSTSNRRLRCQANTIGLGDVPELVLIELSFPALFHDNRGALVINGVAKRLVIVTGVIGDPARLDGMRAKGCRPSLRNIVREAAMHDLGCCSQSGEPRSTELDHHERLRDTKLDVSFLREQI
jgi:hypothetical protein